VANDNLPNGVRNLLASQGKTFVSLETEASGNDNTFVFETDDYTQDSRAVAVQMAVDTINESQNIHKLSQQQSLIRITQDNGKPVRITNGGPGSDNSFAATLGASELLGATNTAGIRRFETTSNSEQFSNIDNSFEVIKGNAEPTSDKQKNYISLLASYNNDRDKSLLAKAVVEVQDKNNRFSQENKFLIDGQKENETGVNVIPIQNIPGQHTPQVWPNTAQGTEVQLKNLKNLGLQLLLKASGEVYVPIDIDNVGEAVAAKAASLVVPGYVRLGAKLPMSNIEVDGIISEINPEFSKNKSPTISGVPAMSHGSYNNPLAPFDSFDSRSSAAGTAALVATVAGIVRALAITVDTSQKANTILNTVFGANSRSFLNASYVPKKNDFIKCVTRGFEQFFAIEGDNVLEQAGNGLRSFNAQPGYYNVILRGIVRLVQYDIINNGLTAADLLTAGIGRDTAGFGAAVNRDLDVNRNVGLTNDPTNVLNIVREFANSKLFGFINVLAQMGDIAITRENAGLKIESTDNPLEVGPSMVDNILDFVEEDEAKFGSGYLLRRTNRINPASLIMKNRLSETAGEAIGQKSPLAWGSSTTPSTYLLPQSIINAAEAMGDTGGSKIKSKLSGISGIVQDRSKNRLPGELVDKIEELLDASYMPFYFHDLRTNEIISFHAFLESITDNFAAEYNEQTAYGRIGKIYTYKNTDRTISLSFMTVAVNEQDFEDMWWKINKLITMVYPQYTAGRTIETEGSKFIQPFSQIPSASPLIRLRLGDLLKTNYSKFNIARMFGLGESENLFKIGTATQQTNQQTRPNPEEERVRADIRSRLERGDFQIGDKFVFLRKEAMQIETIRRGRRGQFSEQRVELFDILPPDAPPPGAIGTITQIRNSDHKQYKASFEETGTRDILIDISGRSGSTTTVGVDQTYLEQKVREQLPNQSTNNPNQSESQTQSNADAITNFFSNENNPILKSFGTVRGKGMPGFIKSIDFDWAEAMWETTNGSKAPKSCKISITFAPIWDINPGLDSNGYSTSPVYGVGGASNAHKSITNEGASTGGPLLIANSAKYSGGGNNDPQGGLE
jgi:hypothetical protein